MSGSAPERVLTPEQEQAVRRRRGSLLLAAGAGSGKTAVLVERFVRAVLEDGIAPSAILAITFTERAAWEMAERLRLRLRELEQRDLAREVENASLGTFHGFCARLLRTDPLAAGIAPGFAVLADGVASRMRREAFEEALRAVIAQRSEQAVDLAAAYGVDRLRGMVIGVHEQLRSRGQRRPRLPDLAAGAGLPDSPGCGSPGSGLPDSPGCGSPGPGLPDSPGCGSPGPAALACELIGLLLERFGEAYEARKLGRGAVDFDDLELGALGMLRESEVLREQFSQRFELIMVDEFQDTNPRQLELLAAIERENVFMVGDEWQSIYGFRHADVGIFRARSAELGRRDARLALTQSFRSVPGVIDAVNRVFGERFGESYTPLRAARGPSAEARTEAGAEAAAVEVLLTDRDGWGDDPELAARMGDGLPESSVWRQAEARHLARRVEELLGEGLYGPGDVAVLLRATKDLYVYERALAARGVPTLATAGGFWSGAEVRDLLAYLRALANPFDELALYGVLASPLVGLSVDALALIAERARGGRKAGLWRTLLSLCRPFGADGPLPAGDGEPPGGRSPQADVSPPDARGVLARRDGDLLAEFCERFARGRRLLPERSLARVIRDAVAASGYLDRIAAGGDRPRAEANLRKLARLASDYERSEGPDLRGLIDHAEHLAEGGARAEPDAPAAEDRLDAVRLMSIHAAKGLEFPVVCVADLGRSPGRGTSPDMIVQGDRIGLRLASIDGGDPEPQLDYEELLAAAREAEAQEEDRVLYVAMTRARDLLLLSGACRLRRRGAASSSAAPIEWLAPALIDDLERRLDAWPDEPPGSSRAGEGAPRLLLYRPSAAEIALPCSADPASTVAVSAGAATGPDRPLPGRRRASSDAGAGSQAPRSATAAGTLSYTSLTRLERCGYRHYLEGVLGLREQERAGHGGAAAGSPRGSRLATGGAPGATGGSRLATGGAPGATGPPLGARATGELAHAVLQRIDFARGRGPEPGDVAGRARELGIEIGRAGCTQMAEIIGGLMGTELAARIAAAPQLDTEQPFAFSIGRDRPLIVGTFDLLAREPDGRRLIVDYKSGGLEGEDLERLAREEFGAQRLIYALAALADGAEQVEVVHWFLRRPEHPVSVCYRSARAQALRETLRERIDRVDERGFAVSERPHRRLCEDCPGRRRLCSWSERETMRELPASAS